MKRKLSFLFLSALTIPFFMGSCSDDKEEQEVKPATDLVVDNNSVTLLQGDEITVSITSGNGDYYVKPFDENVATATINGNKVTIKATENSQLEENNRTETTILIVMVRVIPVSVVSKLFIAMIRKVDVRLRVNGII